jgi:hypothetical protein
MNEDEFNFDPAEFLIQKDARTSRRKRNEANFKVANEDTPFTIVGNDSFFKLLYQFHQGSGFFCIVLTHVCHLLTVLFTILFSTFLTTCVDWKSIHNGEKKKFKDAIYPSCSPERGRNPFITFTFVIFFSYWVYTCAKTGNYISRMWKIREIWTGILGLSSNVKWVTWQSVIDRYHTRVDGGVDSYYIVNRIMRWDNYLIAMLTKDTMGLNKYGNVFTKVIQWNLHRCLLYTLFRDDETLVKDVMLRSRTDEYVQQLRKNLMICGVLNLLGAPFVLCAQTVYFIYRHVSEYHHNPKAIGMYVFTPMARWKLRHFNELPHVYTARLNNAHPKIIEYLAQFASEENNIILKFISFVLGATLQILAVVAFLYPDVIISLFLIEQPVIVYIGTIALLYTITRNNTVEEFPPSEPEMKFTELLKTLHYSPASWANISTLGRHQEIQRLFRYQFLVFLQEVASIIYGPFLFFFYLPTRAHEIVNFFRENSVHVDKLGIICSCAIFDAERAMIEATDDDIASITSSVGRKTSTSLLNFKRSYPTWDPVRFKRYTISHNMMDDDISEDRDLEGDPPDALPSKGGFIRPQNVRDYLEREKEAKRKGKEKEEEEEEYGTPKGSRSFGSESIFVNDKMSGKIITNYDDEDPGSSNSSSLDELPFPMVD